MKREKYLPTIRVQGIALGLAVMMAISSWAVNAAEPDETPQPREVDLMIQAVEILEGARNPTMAGILKRAVNARQIRQLGNLGNLTASDYEILKAAPAVSKEKEALTVAVSEFKRDGQGKVAAALQAILDKRFKKAAPPVSAESKRSNDIARLEAKIVHIRKLLTEVESELARVKAR